MGGAFIVKQQPLLMKISSRNGSRQAYVVKTLLLWRHLVKRIVTVNNIDIQISLGLNIIGNV